MLGACPEPETAFHREAVAHSWACRAECWPCRSVEGVPGLGRLVLPQEGAQWLDGRGEPGDNLGR